jgi:hypothetical protein
MSAEELLGIATAQAAVLQKFNQPTPQAAPMPVQQNRFDMDIADDEYLDGRKVKAILGAMMNQPAPVDYAGRQMAAQAIYAAMQLQHPEEFRKWKPEIDREISKLAPEYWTNDNLRIIVKMVRSEHVDELAAEKAQQLVNESHPTIRSGTGGSGSGPLTPQRTLASDSLPKGWVDRAKALGIDEQVVREFCEVTNQTPDQYLADVEKFGKGSVIRG